LYKFFYPIFLVYIFLAPLAWAEDWYVSNAGGMALEKAQSRFAALRHPYSLAVKEQSAGELPELLAPYYRESWIVELRVLYKDGEESRSQWVFRDAKGLSRLVAVFSIPQPDEEAADDDSDTAAGEDSAGNSDTTGSNASDSDTTGSDASDSGAVTAADVSAGDGEDAAENADAESDTAVAGGDLPTGTAPIGFIEIYSENGLITSERQFSDDGGELVMDFQYRPVPGRDAASPENLELLIRSDTRQKYFDQEGNEIWEDVCTDSYRYTRNLSLRSIERIYHQSTRVAAAPVPETELEAEQAAEGQPPDAESQPPAEGQQVAEGQQAAESRPPVENQPAKESRPPPVSLRFPRRSLDSTMEENFVAPALAYGSQFLEDIQAGEVYRVVYTTDERGRILEETRIDEDGNVIGELRNIWSGNRINRVIWRADEDERITEYEYNADGDRVSERNYNNGILERIVYIDGDREDEELYMNGELILRAQWERGRKLREERVRPSRAAPGGQL
jgi:YD repeat-containing protein